MLGFAGIFVLGRSCAPLPPPRTTTDTVSVKESTHGRPPPSTTPGVIHDTVPLTSVVTREVPDSALVLNYAKLALQFAEYRHRMEQRAPGDTTPPPPAPKEVLPPMALSYSGKVLTMWLTPSSGRVARFTSTGKLTPKWQVVAGRGGASDTRPLVIEDRPWVQATREVRGCLLPTGVAMALGAVLFPKNALPAAATTGGGALAACLWD